MSMTVFLYNVPQIVSDVLAFAILEFIREPGVDHHST